MSKKTKQIEQRARAIARDHIPSEDAEIRHDGENYIQSEFIGSILSITPSGKYYLPFACSNLKKCQHCEGSGIIENPRYRRKSFDRAQRQYRRVNSLNCRRARLKNLIPFLHADKFYQRREKYGPTACCPHCGGLCSTEAYHDLVFRDALEDELGLAGCYLVSGEGDALDLFAQRTLEEDEVALRDVLRASSGAVECSNLVQPKGVAWLIVGFEGEPITPPFDTEAELRQYCLDEHENLLRESLGDEFDDFDQWLDKAKH